MSEEEINKNSVNNYVDGLINDIHKLQQENERLKKENEMFRNHKNKWRKLAEAYMEKDKLLNQNKDE